MSNPTAQNEHEMVCRECGETFDMRSLTEVFIHEHDGFVPEDGIDRIGEQLKEDDDD